MEESITYEEAVARVADELKARYDAIIAEQPSSIMEFAMREVRMSVVLDDKMSHSKAVAVMFRRGEEDVFKDVTDVLKDILGDNKE